MTLNANELRTHITRACKTRASLEDLVSQLHKLSNTSYALDFALAPYIQRNFPTTISDILFKELSGIDTRTLGVQINALAEVLSSYTTIKLTLAFVPDAQYTCMLYDWRVTNIREVDFGIELVHDQAIVAGLFVY